jgi:hypothetical protein
MTSNSFFVPGDIPFAVVTPTATVPKKTLTCACTSKLQPAPLSLALALASISYSLCRNFTFQTLPFTSFFPHLSFFSRGILSPYPPDIQALHDEKVGRSTREIAHAHMNFVLSAQVLLAATARSSSSPRTPKRSGTSLLKDDLWIRFAYVVQK